MCYPYLTDFGRDPNGYVYVKPFAATSDAERDSTACSINSVLGRPPRWFLVTRGYNFVAFAPMPVAGHDAIARRHR